MNIIDTAEKLSEKEDQSDEEDSISPLRDSWRPDDNDSSLLLSSNDVYGEDSIEIAPSDLVDEEIFNQSDLTERIIDAEKRFSTSSIRSSKFASDYLEHPALYRVLFMGSITKEKKKEIFKKLSQGLVHVLQQQLQQASLNNSNHTTQSSESIDKGSTKASSSSLLQKSMTVFKEVKHNVLLLSVEDESELTSDTCEDMGVSMIEADFTWNSNATMYSNDPNNLLLQYAWKQCPNPNDLHAAWLEEKISKTEFKGYVYPEPTPNGIDLCVYFYDGQDDERTKKDLLLLCTLRQLGIYVLPLTSNRDEGQKSHFADMLTEYKVRCLDLGNLEVGQEPSFFQKNSNNNGTTAPIRRLSRLQGMECTELNIPRVATYQILAVEQFCSIKNRAIFELLKRTRERQVIKDVLKEEFIKQHQQLAQQQLRGIMPKNRLSNYESDDSSSEELMRGSINLKQHTKSHHSSPPYRVTQNTHHYEIRNSKGWYFDYRHFLKVALISLLAMICFTYILDFLSALDTPYLSMFRKPHQWTVQFEFHPDRNFSLHTRNSTGKLDWAATEPQVWLNDEHHIPIERIPNEPGYYELKLDFLSSHSQNNSLSTLRNHHDPNRPIEKFTSFIFTVNTSSHLDNIVYTIIPNNPTYVLLYFNSMEASSSSRTTTSAPALPDAAAVQPGKQDQPNNNKNNNGKQEDDTKPLRSSESLHAVDNKISYKHFMKSKWDSFVFYASNMRPFFEVFVA